MENKNRNYFLIALFFVIVGGAIGYFISMELKKHTAEPSSVQDEMSLHIQRINDEIYFAEQDYNDYKSLKSKLDVIISDSSLIKKIEGLAINTGFSSKIKKLDSLERYNEMRKYSEQAYSEIFLIIRASSISCYSKVRIADAYQNYERTSSIVEPLKRRICDANESLLDRLEYDFYDFESLNDNTEFFLNSFSRRRLRQLAIDYSAEAKRVHGEVNSLVINSESLVKAGKNRISELKKSLKDLSEKGVSRLLILYAVPIFGLLLLILMIIPSFYSSPDIKKAIFDSGLLLQLVTVFLLTAIILLLGIGNKLNSEVLGTLLGGISVYVLQQSSRAMNKNSGVSGQQDNPV